MPAGERLAVVVPDADLVRLADVSQLSLERVLLTLLEVVALVVQLDLVRLEVLAVFGLAVRLQEDVGVRARHLHVARVHHDMPRRRYNPATSTLTPCSGNIEQPLQTPSNGFHKRAMAKSTRNFYTTDA